MSRVQIIPLTFRDVCYIAANIRQEDWNECRCQILEENKFHLANYCYFPTQLNLMWCAYLDNQPVTAFGIMKAGPTLGNIWLFSTKKVRKVFPTLLKFMDTEVRNTVIKEGFRRLEIRALETHDFVRNGWMDHIGAINIQFLPQYGKNGEDFRLYAWWKGMPNERDVRNCYNRVRDVNARVTPGYESAHWQHSGGANYHNGNGSSISKFNAS